MSKKFRKIRGMGNIIGDFDNFLQCDMGKLGIIGKE
jgi:hypothetical protein